MMAMIAITKRVLLVVFCASMAFGCNKQKLIPNTKIPDSKINRELIRVIAKYRDAMVRKDTAQIMTMVHPTYQDNSGTADPKDDVDFPRLRSVLETRFKRAERVRYRIEFQRVEIRGREAWVDSWIDATFVYKHPGHMPRYRRFADYHRYRLLNEDGNWRFIGGL